MTRVKICGITNTEDALVAAEAGADLLGFIFYPPSPRSVTPDQAHQITEALHVSLSPCPRVSFVGVFVDGDPDSVRQIVAHCGLDYVQLHGAEPPEMVRALMDEGIDAIKGFRVRDGGSLAKLERYQATAYLLDTYVPGQPGGTGKTFDWELAMQAREHGPILLAGGLVPENVAEAIRVVRPWGVDVASGVEAAPGRKDHEQVRRFVVAAKSSE